MPARLALALAVFVLASVARAEIPAFRMQEIDRSLQIGYGVRLADLNGDEKLDILVADKHRVIWFENPSWQLRVITKDTTTPDNVSLDVHDIDGDGQLDLALAAGWKPGNTKDASTLQWLRRGKTLDEPWQMFTINYDEPTLHRIRWDDNRLLTVPLMGRAATKENNWSETGVKIHSLSIPADPTKPDWPAKTLSDVFHVPHGFYVTPDGLLIASYEGATLLTRDGSTTTIGKGDQSNANGSRGASEITQGRLADGTSFIATIEPWHGHQIVAYIKQQRHVIDDQLRWGHAIWCADLDGDGGDEIIAGVRDPLPGKARPGVRIYRSMEAAGAWERAEIDPGGVAVEDLAVADLNADGKPDIVAVGRQTKNVRIYWNQKK